MAFTVIYITHPDEGCARNVSEQLLREKLVACGNIFPITSAYWWQGEIQHEGEWVSILKTVPENVPAVEALVLKIHPYELPCILRFPVEANEGYERWIRESVINHGDFKNHHDFRHTITDKT